MFVNRDHSAREAAWFRADQVPANAGKERFPQIRALSPEERPIGGRAKFRHHHTELMVFARGIAEDNSPDHPEPRTRELVPVQFAPPAGDVLEIAGLGTDDLDKAIRQVMNGLMRVERLLLEPAAFCPL